MNRRNDTKRAGISLVSRLPRVFDTEHIVIEMDVFAPAEERYVVSHGSVEERFRTGREAYAYRDMVRRAVAARNLLSAILVATAATLMMVL